MKKNNLFKKIATTILAAGLANCIAASAAKNDKKNKNVNKKQRNYSLIGDVYEDQHYHQEIKKLGKT